MKIPIDTPGIRVPDRSPDGVSACGAKRDSRTRLSRSTLSACCNMIAFYTVVVGSGCSQQDVAPSDIAVPRSAAGRHGETSVGLDPAKTDGDAHTSVTLIHGEGRGGGSDHLPENDNWETETQSAAMVQLLRRIALWIESGQEVASDLAREISASVARDFSYSRPSSDDATESTYRDVRVIRSKATGHNRSSDGIPGSIPERARKGTEQVSFPTLQKGTLFDFLRDGGLLSEAVSSGVDQSVHAKFKLVRIEPLPDGADTLVRLEFSRQSISSDEWKPIMQRTAAWRCRWRFLDSQPSRLQLASIYVQQFEDVSRDRGTLFADCTEAALGGNDSYAAQVRPGIPFWLSRLPKNFLGQFGHHGAAVGDINGDGLDDLYACDAGGLPNRIYVQQSDGTAVDCSAESGVDFLDDSTGVLLIDLDNDGDQDLIVATDPTLQVCENDGTGHFALRQPIRVDTDSLSLSAADYDVDGDLDLYVCGYRARKTDPTGRALPFPIPYHDANNGGRNLLLRNEGDFRFLDVTDRVGLGQNNSRFSMAAAWEDFDNDGDLDLYVANDFGRNSLYQNDGGHFRDVASGADVEDHASGMSVSCGDFDRNGFPDIYVGNMFSAAGNRVTFQERFVAESDRGGTDRSGLASVGSVASHLQRMARGNTLFQNVSQPGRLRFEDATDSRMKNVAMGRWAWASPFVDMTNDGWLDLVVANGYLTNQESDDL